MCMVLLSNLLFCMYTHLDSNVGILRQLFQAEDTRSISFTLLTGRVVFCASFEFHDQRVNRK